MKRVNVESSSIRSMGYDPDNRRLEIEFMNGRVYRYARFPARIYHRLMKAPSKGGFFTTVIRPNFEAIEVAATRKEGGGDAA